MKPQTAKDLIELYDECLGYVIAQAGYDPAPTVDLETLVDYLRNKQTVVVEDDWDDHKPQTVGVEFPPLSPQTNLIRKDKR